jgi:glucose/arabinose dehydrogenase/nitrite reductase/ring-hydroxylating ferredoxin subunit
MKKPILAESIETFGFPITIAFAKDGRAYLSERMTGRLWQINNEQYRLIHTFKVVPLVGHHETGFFGIALDPDFTENSFIYCYYTAGTSEKDFHNVVVRIKEDGTGEEVLIDNIPAGILHNGGILAFGADKTLYIGTGVDNPVREQAQDINRFNGKVLRINRDGSIPHDNPYPNSPVYSYGHRNIFGIAVHPKTDKVYVCDVGPSENDEINIIEKGGNYGWPEVTGATDNPKYINPLIYYTPVITPVQCTFVGDDLYFCSFNESTVHKLTLAGPNFDQVEKDESVYRTDPETLVGVFHGPDGLFYATSKDKIIRFEPDTESPLESIPAVRSVKKAMAYPINLAKGHLEPPKKTVDSLNADEGAIVELDGKKVAAYKTKDNDLITLSPVCTHRGCVVDWNELDKTWDCPCHGSRYEADGSVKKGPADKNLERIAP